MDVGGSGDCGGGILENIIEILNSFAREWRGLSHVKAGDWGREARKEFHDEVVRRVDGVASYTYPTT